MVEGAPHFNFLTEKDIVGTIQFGPSIFIYLVGGGALRYDPNLEMPSYHQTFRRRRNGSLRRRFHEDPRW